MERLFEREKTNCQKDRPRFSLYSGLFEQFIASPGRFPRLIGTVHAQEAEESQPKLAKGYSYPGDTGWERVKHIMAVNEYADSTVEFYFIQKAVYAGIGFGALIGMVLGGSQAAQYFIASNQETKYFSEYASRKAFTDRLMVGMGTGAWSFAWRLGLFSGGFCAIATMISAYRNKCGIIEWVFGGGITGALWKTQLGPKAMVSGGFVGSVLGTILGGTAAVVCWLAGTSMAEFRQWQSDDLVYKRKTYLGQVTVKRMGDKSDELSLGEKYHDIRVLETKLKEAEAAAVSADHQTKPTAEVASIAAPVAAVSTTNRLGQTAMAASTN